MQNTANSIHENLCIKVGVIHTIFLQYWVYTNPFILF